MAVDNTKILTAEQESQLRAPIDEYVGAIQEKINALRADGTDKVIEIQSNLDSLKRDRIYTQAEKAAKQAQYQKELEQAKAVEAQHKDEISKLIAQAESYLKEHYDREYFQPVAASCIQEKAAAQEKYQAAVAQLNKEHQETLSKLSDQAEIKDEKYVHKNRLFDAKMQLDKDLQAAKDRRHAAFDYKYHLIDMLRMSKFTFSESMAQRWENYKYTFNRRDFLLRNGLYIAIIIIFVAMCIFSQVVKNTPLLTVNNVLNILQQASPRMFLALGVAGLILLAGTDLSIGRMVGMGMTAATIIMHNGPNTGGVFGHVFDFSTLPVLVRVVFALVVCIVLCTIFTTIAGFFTAKFKMHPFISTMANMLVIFGLVTYSTKGVSFGGIDSTIPNMIMPRINGFPTIILWAVAAVVIVVVHLEQDHLRQEPVRCGRQPGSGGRLRHLGVQGHRRRLCPGRYPVRLWLLAGVYPHVRLRLGGLRPRLGDGRHCGLRSGRRLLHRRHRQDFGRGRGRVYLHRADLLPHGSGH